MPERNIKKNTVYNALKTGSTILFPLITFPYISRVLKTDNVGKINFGLSIISYFILIATLGINTYAIRECSSVREDREKLDRTASQIYTINIITTVIAYLALGVTLLVWRKLDDYRTLILIQSLTIAGTTVGADWLNSAMEDFRYITLRTIAFQVLSLVLMFLLIRKPEDYLIYAAISLLSSVGAGITNIWYRRKYCRIRIITDVTHGIEWKRHLTPIVFLFVMILAQTIFSSVDSTMLGIMHGDREVGIYSAAHKIKDIINQVVASLALVIMPRMSYYFAEGNYTEINRLLRKVLNFYITVGLPCAVGVFMIAKDIILIVSGEDYVAATPALRIMMIGFTISLYGGNFLGNSILLPSRQEKYYMIACCVMAGFNVVANYILIPVWGVTGAAFTTALCSLLLLLMLNFRKDKRIRIADPVRLLLPPAVGSLAIVAVCLAAGWIPSLAVRTIVSILFSGAAYFGIQVLMKNPIVSETLESVRGRLAHRGE